jgi:hypothetical protein
MRFGLTKKKGLTLLALVLAAAAGLGLAANAAGGAGSSDETANRSRPWSTVQDHMDEAKAYLAREDIVVKLDGKEVPAGVIATSMAGLMHRYVDSASDSQPPMTAVDVPASHALVAQAVAVTVLDHLLYEAAKQNGQVVSLSVAKSMAEDAYDAYKKSNDPNKAQGMPEGVTPEQFFLSTSNVHGLQVAMTIQNMRHSIGGTNDSHGRSAEAAWFHKVLGAHSLSLAGLPDVSVASIPDRLPSR